MKQFIGDSHYGPATREIQELVDLADLAFQSLRLERPPVIIPKCEINKNVYDYVESLNCLDIGSFVVDNISYVDNSMNLIDRYKLQPEPETAWAPEWTPYREMIRLFRCRQYSVISNNPVLRSNIIPPLWPIAGQPSVRSDPRIARHSKCKPLVPWLMLCELENDLSDGLLWAITRSDQRRNPFLSLLKIGVLGFVPLGLVDDSFFIFKR